MLKLDNITKSFGDKTVLSGFSAELRERSTTLIVGPSGSGKTTLLRIIAGLESADSGSITMDGSAKISFMFQEPRLFPWMTVCDNVTAVVHKGNKDAAIEILNKLGLANEINSFPSQLSGGMQRRVALARTLLFPADFYLFDEPFAGLDSITAQVAADIIFEYTVEKTSIIVSHDKSMLPHDIETLEIRKLT